MTIIIFVYVIKKAEIRVKIFHSYLALYAPPPSMAILHSVLFIFCHNSHSCRKIMYTGSSSLFLQYTLYCKAFLQTIYTRTRFAYIKIKDAANVIVGGGGKGNGKGRKMWGFGGGGVREKFQIKIPTHCEGWREQATGYGSCCCEQAKGTQSEEDFNLLGRCESKKRRAGQGVGGNIRKLLLSRLTSDVFCRGGWG